MKIIINILITILAISYISIAQAEVITCYEQDGDLRVLILHDFGLNYSVYVEKASFPFESFKAKYNLIEHPYMKLHEYNGKDEVIILSLISSDNLHSNIKKSFGYIKTKRLGDKSKGLNCTSK
ncbi:MAG: hypothetical protein HOO06_00015 [Bdellovibrionaceae bacterium]|jgi:hypothetical protein|nr:hypothetical protein [Pseudobdellovibrionaceae bacterium]